MINQQREMILIVVDNRENNWKRWKKTVGSFDMEEIQMALRNYNTREENEMQELYSLWMMPERKWRFIRIPK